MGLTEMFMLLFRGRTDSYFADVAVKEELTVQVVQDHLVGIHNVGVYPVLDDKTCFWGCADIDDGDFEKALSFARVSEAAGLTCWVEASKSKGYHCWVFAYEAVPSLDMQQAMHFINRMAGTEIDELNPKGEGGDGVLVNCVRLPYFGRAEEGRQIIVDSEGDDVSLEAFVEEALALRVSAGGVAELAGKQRAHGDALRPNRPEASGSGPARTARSDTKAARAWRGERRVQVGERDETLFALSMYMKNGLELTEEEALAGMQRVYEKMLDEPATFALSVALAKVTRAYAG